MKGAKIWQNQACPITVRVPSPSSLLLNITLGNCRGERLWRGKKDDLAMDVPLCPPIHHHGAWSRVTVEERRPTMMEISRRV